MRPPTTSARMKRFDPVSGKELDPNDRALLYVTRALKAALVERAKTERMEFQAYLDNVLWKAAGSL